MDAVFLGDMHGVQIKAFSHLALISTAINLDYQLDHGAGFVAPSCSKRAARVEHHRRVTVTRSDDHRPLDGCVAVARG